MNLLSWKSRGFTTRWQRVQEESIYRPLDLLQQVTHGIVGLFGLIAVSIVLVRLHVVMFVVVLLVGLPLFGVQSLVARLAFDTSVETSPEGRRMRYISFLVATLQAAKEIRVFGLRDYLMGRYRQMALYVRNRYIRNAWFEGIGSSLAVLLGAGGFIGAYIYLIRQVVAGTLTIGDLTVYGGAFLQGQGQLTQIAIGVGAIQENGLFLRDMFEFFDRADELARRPAAIPSRQQVLDGKPLASEAITFHDVSFRYPRGGRDALRDVSLEIAPGQVVAIVGENGAGKTTLIKLLCGLYRPAHGRITIGGVDSEEIDPEARRAMVSVLFQDFVAYDLTVPRKHWLRPPARAQRRCKTGRSRGAGRADRVACHAAKRLRDADGQRV